MFTSKTRELLDRTAAAEDAAGPVSPAGTSRALAEAGNVVHCMLCDCMKFYVARQPANKAQLEVTHWQFTPEMLFLLNQRNKSQRVDGDDYLGARIQIGSDFAYWNPWNPADRAVVEATLRRPATETAAPTAASVPMDVERIKLLGWVETANAKREQAEAFKTWVHNYLDSQGVPADPDPEGNAKHGCRISGRMQHVFGELETLRAENARLTELINNPHNHDWFEGVRIEAAHQQERWAAEHDDGKGPEDWFWLLGYLSGKALRAALDGNVEKAKHHTISSAAALLNWYRRLAGQPGDMRPGIAKPPGESDAE